MKELNVITNAKKMGKYILDITQKSPIKYRYSYVTKMHNLSIEIIENLYNANILKLEDERRVDYQRDAYVKSQILCYISEAAYEGKCITIKQYNEISKYITNEMNLIMAWVNSDKKRQINKK